MSLDNRGFAVGLINPEKTVQKDMLLLYFYHFIIFNLFYTQNNFAHFYCMRHVCFTDDTMSFQQLWQTYLATGSVADLAKRPERRAITARQYIHIQLFYIRWRLVAARSMPHTIFWIQWCHISASSSHIQKQGHATYAKHCTFATMAALLMLLGNNFRVLACPVCSPEWACLG